MTKFLLSKAKLIVKKSPIHGYGVFADEDIQPGHVIEECYALSVNKQEKELINYYFSGGEKMLVLLGYGFIYNHADQPNAMYEFVPELSLVIFRAKRLLKQGEEILISYGDNWFGSRKMKAKKPSFRFRLRHWISFLGFLWRFMIVAGLLFAFIVLAK